jgi:hypothetical protein
MPSRIQSDRGKQLVAASKQFEAWDFDVILEWAGKKRNYQNTQNTQNVCKLLQETAQIVNIPWL